jgi:hypothetical protein
MKDDFGPDTVPIAFVEAKAAVAVIYPQLLKLKEDGYFVRKSDPPSQAPSPAEQIEPVNLVGDEFDTLASDLLRSREPSPASQEGAEEITAEDYAVGFAAFKDGKKVTAEEFYISPSDTDVEGLVERLTRGRSANDFISMKLALEAAALLVKLRDELDGARDRRRKMRDLYISTFARLETARAGEESLKAELSSLKQERDALKELLGGFVKNRAHIKAPEFEGVLDRLMDQANAAFQPPQGEGKE